MPLPRWYELEQRNYNARNAIGNDPDASQNLLLELPFPPMPGSRPDPNSSSSTSGESSSSGNSSDSSMSVVFRSDAQRFLHTPESIFDEHELPQRDLLWSRVQASPDVDLFTSSQIAYNRAQVGSLMVHLSTAPAMICQHRGRCLIVSLVLYSV